MISPAEVHSRGLDVSKDESFHLCVTIAYQNSECYKHALRAYRSVTGRFVGQGEFKQSDWSFDLFKYAHMRQLAVRDAVEADIVIVCANDIGCIDPWLCSWMLEWCRAKTNQPSAIVALFVGPADNYFPENPLKRQLEAIAQQLGLDFFAKTVKEEESTPNLVVQASF